MAKAKHTIRIISGTHGSRRLPVLDFPGLRPTGDRVKEVLFNWLQFHLAGRYVLDLCAGAGSLGFEAASRGAKQVDMVEMQSQISKQLSNICTEFDFKNVLIHNVPAQSYLLNCYQKYDLIFLDPPFDINILDELTKGVIDLVCEGGFMYREFAKTQEITKLPDNWELFRHKTIGQVKIELWQKLNNNEE